MTAHERARSPSKQCHLEYIYASNFRCGNNFLMNDPLSSLEIEKFLKLKIKKGQRFEVIFTPEDIDSS